jgi:uncharacterized cupredoxin-like copper-binding protein
MIRRFIAASAVVTLLLGPGASAHEQVKETAYGRPGDAKKKARVVKVIMRDEGKAKMEFVPNRIEVKRGEQVRFELINEGHFDHEFVLDTHEGNRKHAEEMRKNPDMEHDDPNAKRLAPGLTGDMLWHFTRAGTFEFSCLIPGHLDAGMTGTVVVK